MKIDIPIPELQRILEDAVKDAINTTLDKAASVVYNSDHVWTDQDSVLFDAAERVRSLKVTTGKVGGGDRR